MLSDRQHDVAPCWPSSLAFSVLVFIVAYLILALLSAVKSYLPIYLAFYFIYFYTTSGEIGSESQW